MRVILGKTIFILSATISYFHKPGRKCCRIPLIYTIFLITLILSVKASLCEGSGNFTSLGTYKGVGLVLVSSVGPGDTVGNDRLYQSYSYTNSPSGLDFVSTDLKSGESHVAINPNVSETAAWGMVTGPDRKIYLGTQPNAHLFQYDPKNSRLLDLGRPSSTEQYIWALTVGSDKLIYGVTYPNCKLVRFNPKSSKMEDLGRMDSSQQYGRHIAASSDGFIYIGIGSESADIVAYHIESGRHKLIVPKKAKSAGFGDVFVGVDGLVYGSIGKLDFQLSGWDAIPMLHAKKPARKSTMYVSDGNLVKVDNNNHLAVSSPSGKILKSQPIKYKGKELDVFRLALGPDGSLYGSTVLPCNLIKLEVAGGKITDLGVLGRGELYSLLSYKDKLLMAGYSTIAPLMMYSPVGSPDANSLPMSKIQQINFADQNLGWRPKAMVLGPDDNIYVGALPGYGLLGGTLTQWKPSTGTVMNFSNVIDEESIVSLAVVNGLIVGGTTIQGGSGSKSSKSEAKLFLWNPKTQKKVFEVVPVPGHKTINNLIAAPNGKVFGIADGRMLFSFDPLNKRIETRPIPVLNYLYNSVGIGPDNMIWGIASKGIFTINTDTLKVKLEAQSPAPITGGFAMGNGNIYYASGATVYRYTLQKTNIKNSGH